MKKKILLFAFLFIFFNTFSQTEKTIRGRVFCNKIALQNIDIINFSSKKNSTTDSDGGFDIVASNGDILLLLSNDFIDLKITLSQKDFDQNNIIINLERKPIEIEEIQVKSIQNMKVQFTPEELAYAKMANREAAPKVKGVYTGEIIDGLNFIEIFKLLFGSSKKKKDKITQSLKVSFNEYALLQLDRDAFFMRKLHLKPEELYLFLSFCEKDTRSHLIIENKNLLETIEFLMNKNIEFKKL